VALRRADRVAVDALGRDALAAPALDGVVQADHNRPFGREGVEQQPEQHPRRRPPAPGGAVQHPVVVGEAPLAAEPADPQHARHRARPGRQHGAQQQRLGVAPTPLPEEWREA
jgi:hypothetical protein